MSHRIRRIESVEDSRWLEAGIEMDEVPIDLDQRPLHAVDET